MQLLYQSGLRLVLWGVETGSPRIHEPIKKGVGFERRLPILKGSADAGIWNFAYIFFGFPTETREEAQSTIDMIGANTDIIHSYGRSVFTLGRHSALYREAEQQGILEVHESFEELSANAHYTIRTDEGMKDDELAEMMARCTSSCEEAYGRGMWFYLRYREFTHLYVQRFGIAWVSDRKVGTHDRPNTSLPHGQDRQVRQGRGHRRVSRGQSAPRAPDPPPRCRGPGRVLREVRTHLHQAQSPGLPL
jgi:hypothetical protein